ncbi:VOC family protein [Sphingoaurantiacus capsulatus]|uniref:VOC family protein n=1 Tax=Sphingoaurantiacus capsulatus TaxID=1771310 RepID=A0ABV7XDZ0_9SPHN
MIGYVLLGTNDNDRANAFYDKLFAVTGSKRVMEFPGCTVWGRDAESAPHLGVTTPYNQERATAGNGTMVALHVDSRALVDAIHAKAISLGGQDEGAPGVRGDEGPGAFYAAYFRDPDGNKLCAFRIGGAVG